MFLKTRAARLLSLALIAGGFGGAFQNTSRADSVNLGQSANYAVLGFNSLQDNFSLVTVNGNVGVGGTSSLHIFAPSAVNGNVLVGTGASFTNDKAGNTNVSGTVSTGQNLTGAVNDAISAYNTYTALAPTQIRSGISSPTIITGNGGTNVIDINGDISSALTLNGNANDLFILNVTGNINLGGSDGILGGAGINPNQIVIDLIGTDSVNTHVGNTITGTVIAPNSTGNLDGSFNGRLFFGGTSLTLLSGAIVNQPNTPPPAPLPAPLWSAAALLAMLGLGSRLRIARLPI